MDREELTQVADDIDAIHDYILTHGWVQGRSENALGEVCVYGAMDHVAGVGTSRWNHMQSVVQTEVTTTYRMSCITTFNDMNGRTEDEVLDMLRTAAKGCREQAGAL